MLFCDLANKIVCKQVHTIIWLNLILGLFNVHSFMFFIPMINIGAPKFYRADRNKTPSDSKNQYHY